MKISNYEFEKTQRPETGQKLNTIITAIDCLLKPITYGLTHFAKILL
jgi:hypothetical protein